MAQLRRTKKQFDEAGVRVLLVGMGTEAETSIFQRKFKVPYPMVCDPEQRLYKAFELEGMSLFDALKPTVVAKGISALAKRHGIGVPHGDIRQLPGAFIIDRDGTITYGHHAKDPADHPAARDILTLL